MVTSSNWSRRSSTFQMTLRTGGKAMPPATNTHVPALAMASTGKTLPYGPRKVMDVADVRLERRGVTRPALRNVHSM